MVLIRPAFEAHRRVKDVLHAMHDDRPRRIVGKRDDALHAQQFRALRLAQHREKRVESRRRDRFVGRDAEGADRGIVAVRIVGVPVVMATCASASASALSHAETSAILPAGS